MTNKNTKTETEKKPAFRHKKNVHISTNAPNALTYESSAKHLILA